MWDGGTQAEWFPLSRGLLRFLGSSFKISTTSSPLQTNWSADDSFRKPLWNMYLGARNCSRRRDSSFMYSFKHEYWALTVPACVHVKSLQSCRTLCDPTDYHPSVSSVHGILQARILEWIAMPSSRRSSRPRDGIEPTPLTSLALAAGFFTTSTSSLINGTWLRHGPSQSFPSRREEKWAAITEEKQHRDFQKMDFILETSLQNLKFLQ